MEDFHKTVDNDVKCGNILKSPTSVVSDSQSIDEKKNIATLDDEDRQTYSRLLGFKVPQEFEQPIIFLAIQCLEELNNHYHFNFQRTTSENYLKEFNFWKRQIKEILKLMFKGSDKYLELEFSIDSAKISDLIAKDQQLSKAVLVKLLTFIISQGHYNAKSRVYLNHLRQLFKIKYQSFIKEMELPVAACVCETNKGISYAEHSESRDKESKNKRWISTTIGAALGGTALAISGGLAAPLILPAMGTLFGASAIFTSAGSAALLTTLFGASGAGLTGYKVSKRVSSIKDFQILHLNESTDSHIKELSPLHIIICCSGWIRNEKDLINPWQSISEGDLYSTKFDVELMSSIGNTLTSLFASQVIGYTASEILKKTIFNGVLGALAWPVTILQLGSVIDNPWSLGIDRAKKAGLILADVLASRTQGSRPVNLLSYSLGCVTVFTCLKELSEKAIKDPTVYSIIENVVFLGAPITNDRNTWLLVKSVVNGKIVNGYSKSDWILAFLHRAYSYGKSVAGITDLNEVWDEKIKDIENVDLTEVITGHLDYIDKLPEALTKVGIMM